MNPCGSGQRLWRMGRYEGADGHAVMEEEHDWSYNRKGFPIYCTHCTFMNEILPIQWIGYPGSIRATHPRTSTAIPAPGTGTRIRRTFPTATGNAMSSSAASDLLLPAGRRVIVTGARGGIGRAITELLESAGCSVAGCDVEEFDVRDREAVDAGVARMVDELGGCDSRRCECRRRRHDPPSRALS